MALALCIASILLLLYVIALYPVFLAIVSRRKVQQIQKKYEPRTVSVLLTVRNGERWIRRKLETIFAQEYPPELLQILVISDGSTDATEDLAREHGRGRVEVIRVPQAGKASALNAGMERATGEILFFTDVRQALSPNTLHDLVSCFADPSVGAATGELVILYNRTTGEGPGLYWRYEVWIRTGLSRLGVLQGATGCIYALRREFAVRLPQQTLVDDVYLPLSAFFAGKRIVFEPAAQAFDDPTELSTEFRRKVRTLAGVYQVIGAYPRLLWPGTRGWVHFVSHKLGRLLLPFALIVLLIASSQLPPPLGFVLLAGQSLAYGLALLDPMFPASFPLKRITTPARTFVVLMAAAFVAAFAWLIPAQALWKSQVPPAQGRS